MIYWPITIHYRKKSPDMTYQEFFESHMKKIPSEREYNNIIEELNDSFKYTGNGYDVNESYIKFKGRYTESARPKYFLYVENTKTIETVEVNNVQEFQMFLEYAKEMEYDLLITDEAKGMILNPSSLEPTSHGTTAIELQPVYSRDIQNILGRK